MNNIKLAFRSLGKSPRGSIIKILSLAVGLALGIVLIAKVCFEKSYDRAGKDPDRVFLAMENVDRGKGAKVQYNQTSGGISAAMKAEIPEVEASTKITWMLDSGSEIYQLDPRRKIVLEDGAILAEPNVFELIGGKMLTGDISSLADRNTFLVSRRVAEKFGGVAQAVGKSFYCADFADTVNVTGVFENCPENSSFRYDAIMSMKMMPDWSNTNFLGNDRYVTFARLVKGATPKSVQPSLDKMYQSHLGADNLKFLSDAGTKLNVSLSPLENLHTDDTSVKNSITLLSILAALLLFTALMNYVLIVLSTMPTRSKEVAVEKCYGAEEKEVLGQFSAEAFVHVLIALLLAAALILAFRGKIETLVNASLGALLSPTAVGAVLLVALVIFLATALIPTLLYINVPVAAAFRGYHKNRRGWKLALLAVQFGAAALLVSLLLVISRQYNSLANEKTGYSYEKLAYCKVPKEQDKNVYRSITSALASMPEVSGVTSECGLPIDGVSGNDVSFPAETGNLERFNAADFYFVGDDYFKTMGIPVVEGKPFDDNSENDGLVMISRKCADKLVLIGKWSDGAVGKQICVSEHSDGTAKTAYTICGVFSDIKSGSDNSPDTRPQVIFPYNSKSYIVPTCFMIQMKDGVTASTMQAVKAKIQEFLPGFEVEVKSYQESVRNQYQTSKHFRDAVMVGGIVTLILALIGLLGYIFDEAASRGREIAIRKVNGATSGDISSLFVRGISYVAVPALVAGAVAAYFIGRHWLTGFATKTPLYLWIFILAVVVLYAVIAVTLLLSVRGIAAKNPTDNLKLD